MHAKLASPVVFLCGHWPGSSLQRVACSRVAMNVDIGELLQLCAPAEPAVAKRRRRSRPVGGAVAAPRDSIPSCADLFALRKLSDSRHTYRVRSGVQRLAFYILHLKTQDGIGLAMLGGDRLGVRG